MKALNCLQWFKNNNVKFNTTRQVDVIYPTQSQYIYGDELVATWLAFPKAKQYRVIVGADDQIVTGLTATFSGLTDGDKEFTITAIRDGVSCTDNVIDFSITNIEPAVIVTPTEEYIYVIDTLPDIVTITSIAELYYEEYYFQIYTILDVLVSEGIGGAGGSPEQYEALMSAYGHYKCRVKAKVAGGEYGDYSAFVNFSVSIPT